MMGASKSNECSQTWRIRKSIISGLCLWLLIGIESVNTQVTTSWFRHENTISWSMRTMRMIVNIGGPAGFVVYTRPAECSSATFDFNAQAISVGSISATAVNTEIASYTVSNVEKVTVSALQGYNLYLDAVLETTQQTTRLNIKTDEKFADFLLTETIPELRAQLDFTCSSSTTRTIRIQVTIREENLYAPTFKPEEYVIQLPLPLPKNFDLTQFVNEGKGIIAYDYDLTGNEVDFSIENNAYFQVEQIPGASGKEFIARLRTLQTLTHMEATELKITGTDRGNPQKTGTAQLKIAGDPLIPYIAPPQFAESLYRRTYKRTEAFVPVEVVLTAGTFDDSVNFLLSGDNGDLFTVTAKSDHSGASVTLKSGVTIEETTNFLNVLVTATRVGAEINGRTAIVVEVEPEVKILPAFEQPIYSGTIGQEKDISLANPIKLVAATIVDGVQVTLDGEDAEFFVFSNSAETISLRPSEKLTEEVLNGKFYFHVTVKASKPEIGSNVAIVVLEVLKKDVVVPKFEQLYYEGTVTEEGLATIPEIKIIASTFVEGLVFNRAGEADLFSFSQDGNKLTLVPNSITEEKLRDKFYLIEKISAVVEDQVVAETIVIIKVVRTEIVVPKFEENLVQGQLAEGNLQLTPMKVIVDPNTYNSNTELALKDSSNLLVLTQSSTRNEYTIGLRSGVQLPTTSHITAIVEATNPKSATVHCFVLIEVIREPLIAPEFEKALYESTINSNVVLQELILRVKPETYDDTIVCSLQDADAEFFQLRKLDNNDIQIILNDSISEDALENRNNLRFSVRAMKSSSLDAIVPVIVFLEKAQVQAPRFEKALYKSNIRPDLTLVPFETIKLEDGTGSEGLEILITQSNSDLFAAQIDQDGHITISLRSSLTPQDVEGLERFEFVLQVTNPGVGAAFATIVIDIERNPVVEPEFTEVSYHGTLQEGAQEIIFTDKISLRAETITSDVHYALLSGDHALIELSKNEDASLKFMLKSDVTVDQLKGKTQLNFVVQAVNPGSSPASASIVVQIVRPVRAVFTKSSFSGVLTEGQTLVAFSDKIELVEGTFTDETVLQLSEGDSNLFQVTVSSEKIIQISLGSEILWTQVRFHPYLTFKLTATNPGSEPSSTTILVNIVNHPVPTPVFTKTFYRGSLQKGVHEVTFPAGEVITIESETITSTFIFRVLDDDDGALFDVTREENKFKVSLKSTVDEQTIEGRDLLSFTIEANNEFGETDRATVIVSIQLDEIVTPTFSNNLYRGSIKERTTDVSLTTTIGFLVGTSSSNTEVGLVDGEADWFTARYANSQVTIAVKNENLIDWDDINDRSYLSFALQATNPGSSAASAFVTLDIQRDAIPTPRFKASSFQGVLLEGSSDVQFSDGASIELVDDSLVAGFEIKLTEYDHELFDFTQERLQIKVSLKSGVLGEDLKDRTYFRFNVAVNNPGSETATANVLVDLKWNQTPANTPLFEKFFYKGSIGLDLQIKLEDSILIKEETYTADVLYGVVESDNDLLVVEKKNREVAVKLAKAITEDDLKGLESLHVTIRAFNEMGKESFCFLVVSLPREGEEPCPTPTLDCTECYDCSTGTPLEDVPVFEYGNYRFFIKSETIGLIGTVKATVKDPLIHLEHRAEIDNDYVNSRITFTADGILRVDRALIPGQYSFKVTALNPHAQKQSSVNVLLDVIQEQECPVDPDSPKITTVEKLLVIKSLEEESPHLNIFPSQLSTCEYELVDEKPYLGYNYFEIDPETHWLTSKSFDRENTTLFEGMTIPQFQVRLHLVCPDQTPAQSRRTERSLIESEDLNYARDVTVIQVIVTDINDHSPKFEFPSGSEFFHIGFPVSTIASGLMLSELITVRAEDADEGLNAKIRYSLRGTQSYFAIEPETGLVYPLKESMKSSSVVTITVLATDRDGASDGRTAEVQLIVHQLEENHLVALTIPGQMDDENVIRQINSNQEGVVVKVLTQARVPEINENTDDKSTRQSSSEDSVLRMIVYALANGNIVQSSDTIKRVIGSSSVSSSVSVDSFRSVACSECSGQQSEGEDNVGLIVATSILGALFVISAGLAIFLYLRFVRPLKGKPENPSDVVQLENDFDVSPPPSPPRLGIGKQMTVDEPEMEERKVSIQIMGVTDQESEDGRIPTSRLAQSLDDRLERGGAFGTISSRGTIEDSSSLSSVNEPRNVKFNEMVERIEVVEHHLDDQRHRVDDDDSVYSERL